MSLALETVGLTKRYGQLVAVDGLDLAVEAGSVFGFVGPNGAGKTTTMRMLATLLRPTAGEAWVAGCSVLREPRDVRRLIGYVPDSFGVYGDMKVWEYLDFFAACYGLPRGQRGTLVDSLLDLVGLSHRREDSVGALSRGAKQRLCLVRALAHDPAVLILDEPASGLDPRARVEIRELLTELSSMGKTIMVSSHVLSEIEEICTHIGIIESGRMVAAGTLAEMHGRLRTHRVVRIGLIGQLAEARSWLERRSEVIEVTGSAGRANEAVGYGDLQAAVVGDDLALAALLRELVEAGFPVVRFDEEAGGLEDIFLRLTKGVVS